MSDAPGALDRALAWALTVEPAEARQMVSDRQRVLPELSGRALAERVVAACARRGALEGFISGLPSNLLIALPSAVADTAMVLHLYARMSAAVGFIADPAYFEDARWNDDALLLVVGPEDLTKALQREVAAEAIEREVARQYLTREAVRSVKRSLVTWLGKQAARRALFGKAVPVVSGFIGGAWNYRDVTRMGRRTLRYHFEGMLEV